MKAKLKYTLLLLLSFFSVIAPLTRSFQKVSAFESAPIEFNRTGDVGYVFFTSDGYAPNYEKHVVVGFDEDNFDKINRIGFRVTYKNPNWFQNILNGVVVNLFNANPLGKIETKDVLVKASTTHTFELSGYRNPPVVLPAPTYLEEENLEIPAIGLMTNLLKAEDAARKLDPNGYGAAGYLENIIVTGGYENRMSASTRINDSSKTLPHRKFYAIIPVAWPLDIVPESIDVYLMDGTHISDGLDENGEPLVDPGSGDKYIIATPGKHFGIAINGNGAILKRVEVSGYTSGNMSEIKLINGGWDYENHKAINIQQTTIISSNTTRTLNWSIENDNRYIFIQYEGEEVDLEAIKIKFYYDNYSNSSAWILNITDKDGNFLPAGWIPPGISNVSVDIKDIFILIAIIIVGVFVIRLFTELILITARNSRR